MPLLAPPAGAVRSTVLVAGRSFAVLLLAAATSLAGSGETLFVQAGLVIPIEGEPIPEGRIVVRDGKVTEVGAEIERPRFSRLIDASSQVVTPGFVVSVSSLGLPAGSSSRPRRPNQPVKVGTDTSSKAADEFHPLREEYAFLLQQGITTLGLAPRGNDLGFAGQLSAVSLGSGLASELTLKGEAAILLSVASHAPWREKIGALVRKAEKAIEKQDDAGGSGKRARGAAREGKARGGDKKAGKPKRAKDPVQRLLRKQQGLVLAPRNASGWIAATDVLPLDEMEVTILDTSRLYELHERLAEHSARVVTYPVLINRFRTRYPVNRAAVYESAGMPYAFRLPSDDLSGAAALRDAAIEMYRTGCSREGTLRALTAEGAAVLGLADKVGSVKKGARADLLFWSGDPLDPLSRLERVMLAGELVERMAEAGDGA